MAMLNNPLPLQRKILLALQGKELSAIQIKREIQRNGGDLLLSLAGVGILYPALHSLEKKALIESRWGELTPDSRGGARRRYYRLTRGGRRIVQTDFPCPFAKLESIEFSFSC